MKIIKFFSFKLMFFYFFNKRKNFFYKKLHFYYFITFSPAICFSIYFKFILFFYIKSIEALYLFGVKLFRPNYYSLFAKFDNFASAKNSSTLSSIFSSSVTNFLFKL